MKIAITTLMIAFSSLAYSQSNSVEVKQEFLADRADFGAYEISTHSQILSKSLSEDLLDKVLQSSEPYQITNMAEIQTLIDAEKSKFYPSLNLSLTSFKGSKPLNLSINHIATVEGREMLRGEVEGVKGSQVKLVVYEGKMSGRVAFSDSQKVIVIRSIDGGISANYEVDTSDITYD